MSEDIKLGECLKYFKNSKGLHRALIKIREKYRSLGNLGGTIQLSNPTIEEKEALTGYLKRDCFKKTISIKVLDFVNALEQTKYSGIDFIILLNYYFQEDIISKKVEKEFYELEKVAFFNRLICKYETTRAVHWLINLRDHKDNAYKMISQQYDEDKDELFTVICLVCDALNTVSLNHNQLMRLAVLASLITKEPHYFDDDKLSNRLLIYGLVFYLKTTYPENAEQTAEILYLSGIVKDEVSNFTLCSGLVAKNEFGQHEGWNYFNQYKEPLQLSIINLSKIKGATSPTKKVYLFENPTVFIEVFENTKEFTPPLMCTFGNIKLASLILMDKLVESGVTLYYSGDFDPEGLLIADKLKLRYKENLIFFEMTEDNYLNNLSDHIISDKSLNKLKSIKSSELMPIVKLINVYKKATYQELLINEYKKVILSDYI